MINRKRNYTNHFLLLAVLVCVALACVNYLAMEHRTRMDLTADNRFTLSDGTARLFDTLTEPVVVTYYVDEEPPSKRINLERDVRDKLQELSVSSGGKLNWSIERISNSTAAAKQEELEKKGISMSQDFQTVGTDDAAKVRGVSGYFTSLEVKYGLAEPVVINGIVNLVDKLDEMQEHRVDTLEFDISFAILQMRSKGTRMPIRRMVKAAPQPVKFTLAVSEQMPAKNPKLADTLYEALQDLARASGGNASVERQVIPWGGRLSGQGIFLTMGTDEDTVDPRDLSRKGPKHYYAIVQINYGDRADLIYDFRDQTAVEAVLSKLDERLYQLFRPRTRLGFVLPAMPASPHDMQQQTPGTPPRESPYTPLFGYVRDNLGYETVWINLPVERRIPSDLACLMVFEPNRLSERELYEIDRYLAEGGNVVMFYQGWEAKLNQSGPRRFNETLPLTKLETKKVFEDWAASLGMEFGQDMLIDKGGRLGPYKEMQRRGDPFDLQPTGVPLAAIIESGDLNGDSVFTRGMADMPLPMAVAIKLDDAKLGSLGLERTDIVNLKDDIYRLIPQNPATPEVPLNASLDAGPEVERNPDATPAAEARFQKLGAPALVAASLRGSFPLFWRGDRKVPAWEGPSPEGDPLAGKDSPEMRSKPGTLLVCSSAGTLNINYLAGYGLNYAQQVVIPRGVTFFRNTAEAFIFGDDLVRLRARTGVAPRISGELSDAKRMFWIIMCIAGVPIALLLAGVGRLLFKARARQEYENALKSSVAP